MATVRCPQCGAVNPGGARRPGRCRSCREALGKCRYCQHYDPRQLDCVHPSRPPGERILDADEDLHCPDFRSRLSSRPPSRLAPVLRMGAVTLLVGVAFALGYFLFARPPAAPLPAVLKTSVTIPATVFQEDGIEFQVVVVNQASRPARDVRVRISGPSMPHLVCQSVDPVECFEEATPRYTSAWIGELAPGQTSTVGFRFTCRETGEIGLAALVTASNVDVPSKAPIQCEIIP